MPISSVYKFIRKVFGSEKNQIIKISLFMKKVFLLFFVFLLLFVFDDLNNKVDEIIFGECLYYNCYLMKIHHILIFFHQCKIGFIFVYIKHMSISSVFDEIFINLVHPNFFSSICLVFCYDYCGKNIFIDTLMNFYQITVIIRTLTKTQFINFVISIIKNEL